MLVIVSAYTLLVVLGWLAIWLFIKATGSTVVTDRPSGQSTIKLASSKAEFGNIDIYELWQYANKAREDDGLQDLVLDVRLNNSALEKCRDMVSRNYWSHNTPDGMLPWTFIQKAGIKYKKAGENLAYGFKDSKSVIDGWMKSTTHRDNILDDTYTNEGFAVCESGNFLNEGHEIIVVQHFIGI